MIFKNSLKLFIANFSVFWKLLLYRILVIGLGVLLLWPCFNEWGECFSSVEFVENLTAFSTSTVFSNISVLMSNLFQLVQTFVDALVMLYCQYKFAFFYSAFIICILVPFLFGLSAVPTGEGLYSYMSSLSKTSFSVKYVSKLGASCLYSIIRTLILLPVMLLYSYIMYNLLKLTTLGGVLQIFLPIIVVLIFVFLLTMLITFLSGWMPATVVFNTSPIKAFKKGLKSVGRIFWKVFSTVFVIVFMAVLFSMLFTSFSLIVILPLTVVITYMLEMVMFFESQGMRYYVDLDSIVSPKKLEQYDKLSKVKNII